MKRLQKIVCPNKHYEKILMIYREESGAVPIHKFWIHCDNHTCENPWIQIEFNKRHGITVVPMPRDVKFDVEKIPVVIQNGH